MITVLVALKDPLMRLGVESVLEAADDVQVVGTVEEGNEIALALVRLTPQVAVVDALFHRADATLVPRLTRQFPQTKVVVMVDHSDEECVLRSLIQGRHSWRLTPAALEQLNACYLVSLRACARGCISKTASVDRLVGTVRMVAAGDVIAGPWLSVHQLADGPTPFEEDHRIPSVSSRELEVIEHVAEGLENKQIAARLGISEQTVKNHLARIMTKLDVGSRAELAAFAVREHLAP